MTPEELAQLRQAFRPSTDFTDFPYDHVDFDAIAHQQVAEARLFDELTQAGDRGRTAVIGPSGSGKSSLISSSLTRLPSDSHVALIVKAGNAGAALQDPAEFARYVLDALRLQVSALLSAPQRLDLALPRTRTRQTGGRGVTANLKLPVLPVELAAELKSAVLTEQHTVGAAEAVDTLARAVDIIAANHRRPAVVLDDTDKWAGGDDGDVDRDAADGFFRHGVRVLASIDCDLIVAVHTRFVELDSFRNVEHFFTEQITIPRFSDPRELLIAIVAKRLENEELTASVEDLLSSEALTLLEAAYAERPQDLRYVLRILHHAVAAATMSGGGSIDRATMYQAADDIRHRRAA